MAAAGVMRRRGAHVVGIGEAVLTWFVAPRFRLGIFQAGCIGYGLLIPVIIRYNLADGWFLPALGYLGAPALAYLWHTVLEGRFASARIRRWRRIAAGERDATADHEPIFCVAGNPVPVRVGDLGALDGPSDLGLHPQAILCGLYELQRNGEATVRFYCPHCGRWFSKPM